MTATLAIASRTFRVTINEIGTQHAPGRGFVAEWAFWAGDAA